MRGKIAEYITHYKLDLSYQWKDVTILVGLMCRNIAVDYCWSEIRKNPKLLGLIAYNDTTVLHELIRMGKIDHLPETYRLHPEVKQFYENDRGINLLREMFSSERLESLTFILENHKKFLLNNLDKLRENVVFCSYNNLEFYWKNGDILAEHFPMMAAEIKEEKQKDPKIYPGHDLQVAFHKFDLEFNKSSIVGKDETLPLSSVKGIKGLSLLHFAVDKDNKPWFIDLLNAGCDIDAKDDEGNLPIHYVRSLDMFNLIIEKHPEGPSLVHRTNSEGYTVLHKVCSLRMDRNLLCSLLERVIECGANVNQLTEKGESAAFMIGSCTGLDILRKHNVDLEVVNNEGNNALDCHLRHRNVCMGNALLPLMHKLPSFKNHAHKYLECFLASTRDFFSCDYQSFLESNPETTKIIFDSLYKHSPKEASRLFCKACGSAHIFITEKFLDFDYDLDYNYKDDYDYTPFIGLCSYMERPNVHLMRKLLEKGVDLDHRNQWGRNALLVLINGFRSARWYGHDVGSVQLLLDHGAQINSSDDDGNTALHYAFMNEDWELVEMLVENGADLSAKNKEGKNPLETTSLMYRELFGFMQ
ncbi:AAEL003738-PA [Aedes aegypti]|uniref:AAEL003738-PA n=1 Tax=Aedes aegypti TaxID=7159 RepID=Q17EL8_AEDAE|nr:AAEL003738-PA [Aedes aegypti]